VDGRDNVVWFGCEYFRHAGIKNCVYKVDNSLRHFCGTSNTLKHFLQTKKMIVGGIPSEIKSGLFPLLPSKPCEKFSRALLIRSYVGKSNGIGDQMKNEGLSSEVKSDIPQKTVLTDVNVLI
jgi:hypothetical protein